MGIDYHPRSNVWSSKEKKIQRDHGPTGPFIVVSLSMYIFGVYGGGYYCDFNDSVIPEFVEFCNLNYKKGPGTVREIVRSCVKQGIFDNQLYQNFGILTSAEIQTTFFKIKMSGHDKFKVFEEYLLVDVPKKLQGRCETVNIRDILETSSDAKKRKENVYTHTAREDTLPANMPQFTPPTPEQVQKYCTERGNTIDAQYFVDFYTSKDWRSGTDRICDWKAVVRLWEHGDREDLRVGGSAKKKSGKRVKPTQQSYMQRTSRPDPSTFVLSLDDDDD